MSLFRLARYIPAIAAALFALAFASPGARASFRANSATQGSQAAADRTGGIPASIA
jgi:hypothetical protein